MMDPIIPRPGETSPAMVRAWFGNIPLELAKLDFGPEERALLEAYYRDAGLLRSWRLPFFDAHYVITLGAAADYLFQGREAPVILDLGCGTGTQALFFALCGARVVGVDMDGTALGIFRRRQRYYEQLTGSSLPITIVEGDAFAIDYAQHGPFDGVHSLFAFNMMQPTTALLDSFLPAMSPGGRICILDGNWGYWANGLLRPQRTDRLRPRQMQEELEGRSMRVDRLHFGMALPPLLWRVLPRPTATALNCLLCRREGLSVSYQVFAEKLPLAR